MHRLRSPNLCHSSLPRRRRKSNGNLIGEEAIQSRVLLLHPTFRTTLPCDDNKRLELQRHYSRSMRKDQEQAIWHHPQVKYRLEDLVYG